MYDGRHWQYGSLARIEKKWQWNDNPKRGTLTNAQVIDLASKLITTVDPAYAEQLKQRPKAHTIAGETDLE